MFCSSPPPTQTQQAHTSGCPYKPFLPTFNQTFAPVDSYLAIMMKLTCMALLCGAALSFQVIAPSTTTTRRSTQLRESFGFDFAENTYSNQPNLLKGEQEYKQFVNKYKEDNMLNRKVREYKFYGSALVDHRDLTLFSTVLCHPTTRRTRLTPVQRDRSSARAQPAQGDC